MSGFSRAQAPIDLHLHSTISDGSEEPAHVVESAFAAGVRTMSLTDHDSTLGWEEATAACQRRGMTFIPGAELSVSVPNAGGMHLLAYLFDPLDADLNAAMNRVKGGKKARVAEMVERLRAKYDITLDDVLEVAGDAPPQRPHIAAVLISRGYAADTDEVFATILYPGSDFYIPTSLKPDILTAIELVRAAGGVPILAHPTARTGHTMPKQNLIRLLDAGLGGLELDHQENRRNNPESLATLWEYQRELDFIVTGSSDFHGTRKVNQPGDDTTSPEMLERLIASARARSGSSGSQPVYPPSDD
jgi:predicted metal-dependent phosphoesterase TrpH